MSERRMRKHPAEDLVIYAKYVVPATRILHQACNLPYSKLRVAGDSDNLQLFPANLQILTITGGGPECGAGFTY